jgi:hypothetical protein
MTMVMSKTGDETMFTDPMLGAKCVVVDKIVNDTWQEWEHESDEEDPFRPPIVVLARLFVTLARGTWRAVRRVHLLANEPVSERAREESAIRDEVLGKWT